MMKMFRTGTVFTIDVTRNFELMLTRRAKAYCSSGSVV